jgi:hypothetical protein
VITPRLATEVLTAMREHFAITHGIYEFESRTQLPSRCRAESMFVFRALGLTTVEIGAVFQRDHSTVVVACQTVKERLEKVQGYREELDVLLTIARKVCANARQRGMMRERLADERTGYIHKVEITTAKPGVDPNAPLDIEVIDLYVKVGEYPDGRLGEISVTIGKHGDEHAVYDEWCTLASKALQHGIPVETVFKTCVGKNYGKAGPTSNKNIPKCTSILDYIGRWVLARYSHGESI